MADPQMIADLESRLRTILRGRFEVRELLGAGGFGAVFRAFDPTLERDVAIKAFFADQGGGDTDVALDEAKLVARIEHPHIVPLYHAESRDGIVYLVMRCFPDTLRARIDRAPLDPEALARLGAQVADALAAAHERGVVHLDVKPDNILLDGDGNPAVTDFGIARLVGAGDQSPTGMVSGTPHYMSPEQVAGDRVDGRTDVYALGAVLYEAATGQTPVAGDSAAKIMANQVRQAPAALRKVAPELPTAVGKIISKALAKDPDDRWQSARAMATAFREATSAEHLVSPKQARKRARRRWYRRFGILAVGLFAGIIAIGYLVYQGVRGFFGGPPPAVSALAPAIPESILDSALAAGYLTPSDSVRYVFIPNGGGFREGLLVTRTEFVVPSGASARRYPRAPDLQLNFNWRNDHGFLILRYAAPARSDTIYRFSSGPALQAANVALRQVLGEEAATPE